MSIGGGAKSRLYLYLALSITFLFASCGQGGDPQNKPDNKKLKDLTVEAFTIKDKNAKSGLVTIKAESVTIQKREVTLIFNEPNAPTEFTCSEPFPITIKAGNQKTLTFQTAATQEYNPWKKTVTVKCTNLEFLTAKIKVHGEDVGADDSVTLDESLGQVTQGDVDFKFDQTGTDVPTPKYTGLPITLKAGEDKTFTISTDATAKYEPFSRTVKIKAIPKPKSRLNVKALTIYDKPAGSGAVTIPTDKTAVTKGYIKLEFVEQGEGVPTDYTLSPDPCNIANAGEKVTITLSTQETAKYETWSKTIEVTRAKAEGAEKTIDDCVAELTSQLTWAGVAVDKPISLPTTVTGYDASTVEWSCEDEHLDSSTGKIKQDLANVTVETQAKVTWKGQSKTVTFKVTVQRLKRIKWIKKVHKNKSVEHVADFSKEGVLLYSVNNKPCLEFKIKSVDVKAKKLVAKLVKRGVRDELLSIEKLIEESYKSLSKQVDVRFNDKYFELLNKTNVIWDDLKVYLISRDGQMKDEDLFNRFKPSDYQGTFADFKALPSNEQDEMIKKYLMAIKVGECDRYGIDPATPNAEFATKLKEVLKKAVLISSKHTSKEWTYEYSLKEKINDANFPDGFEFDAKYVFDATKQWYDQFGGYLNSSNRIFLFLREYNGELNIIGGIGMTLIEGLTIPIGTSSFSKSNYKSDGTVEKTFTLTLSNMKDGKLTITITGDASGSSDLEFEGTDIFDVLHM